MDSFIRIKKVLLEKNTSINSIVEKAGPDFFKTGGVIVNFFENNNKKIENDEIFTNFFGNYSPVLLNEETVILNKKGFIGQKVFFDTNFVSNLPLYFSSNRDKLKEEKLRIDKIIDDTINKYNGSYDFNFIFFENAIEYEKGNDYPVRKIAAMLILKDVFDGKLFNYKNIFYFDDVEKIRTYTDTSKTLWKSYMDSDVMKNFSFQHTCHYLVLLRFYTIYWENADQSEERIFTRLVLFIKKNFKKLPIKSLYFCWKILKIYKNELQNEKYSMFTEKPLVSLKSKSLKRLKALSWDTHTYRFFESFSTEKFEGKPNLIYLPLLTSLDKKMVKTIANCPIQSIYYHPKQGRVEMIFEDEKEFSIFFSSFIVKYFNDYKSGTNSENWKDKQRYVDLINMLEDLCINMLNIKK